MANISFRKAQKLVLIILISLCTSCSSDILTLHKLNGKWNLVNVTCECAPADLEIDEHQWVFNLKDNEVVVSNSVNKPLQILETGTYSIHVNNSKIIIMTVAYDYYFKDGKLFLSDHPEVDGPLMEFVRGH